MHPDFQNQLGTMLPDMLPFPHFAQREAAWLLARRMGGPARIADLRRGPLAPLLKRPGPAQIIGACGDGRLTPQRLLPVADPLYAFGRERELARCAASRAAFDIACAADWRTFQISFASWGSDHPDRRNAWRQTSRAGNNLVMQVNFPESYCQDFLSIFGHQQRARMEYYGHPVRRSGPITMGWARLDLDEWGNDLLIEEIQTDWLRNMRYLGNHLLANAIKGRRDWGYTFLSKSRTTFAPDWDRVIMLAVLAFAVRELGVQRIWMHQPRTGARLKSIHPGPLPPRSIYTDLPRRFGFAETHRAPEFLYRARSKAVANLRRSGQPVFWLLDLAAAQDGRAAA